LTSFENLQAINEIALNDAWTHPAEVMHVHGLNLLKRDELQNANTLAQRLRTLSIKAGS
jgi:hypothetical protein